MIGASLRRTVRLQSYNRGVSTDKVHSSGSVSQLCRAECLRSSNLRPPGLGGSSPSRDYWVNIEIADSASEDCYLNSTTALFRAEVVDFVHVSHLPSQTLSVVCPSPDHVVVAKPSHAHYRSTIIIYATSRQKPLSPATCASSTRDAYLALGLLLQGRESPSLPFSLSLPLAKYWACSGSMALLRHSFLMPNLYLLPSHPTTHTTG